MSTHGSKAPITSPPEQAIVRRTGGRSARVHAAALDAATHVLFEQGYDALNHRSIAALAGVADTTIYRRWPTKSKLALAVIERLAADAITVPDLGTFEKDLDALAGQLIDYLGRPEVGRFLRGMVAALSDEQEVAEARQAFWEGRFAGAARIVDRAVARGEVAPETAAAEVIETLAAPVYFRVLLTGQPLDAALQRQVVRNTVALYRLQTPA